MKFFLTFNLLIFLINSSLLAFDALKDRIISNSQNEIPLSESIFIKVLLSEMNQNSNLTWKIDSEKEICISTTNQKKKFSKIEITQLNNQFFLNNKVLNNKILKIESTSGNLKFNDKQFQGILYVVNENNKLLLINKVELEDYIFSVLFTESWPGWPLEVNKAFAIASRSYVIAKVLENKDKSKQSFHIKNTNKHQTYFGYHQSKNLRTAVDETKGIVLGHNKKPILAMFDACCGGIVPAHMKGINFKKAPYLERKEKCVFCKSCKLFSWQIDFDELYFENILKKELVNLQKIQNINLNKDKAGIVHTVNIRDKKNCIHLLTGKKIYSLFDKIKSFSFTIKKASKIISVKGNGYGHHLGICQWGAREMVNQGWDYQSILYFFYPNTKFMKLI